MVILALYDIHGNIDALDAVLADPGARDAHAVVVGGDAVPGPFGRAVLERLGRLDVPVHWIRGNGEREVAAAAAGTLGEGVDAMVARTSDLSAGELDAEGAARLGRLELTLELGGVLHCHASPRRDDEILTRRSTEDRWAAALAGVDAATVVAGHTHQQDDRRVAGVRWLNAGSVGLPYEGDGAARWLRLADGVPELRRTPYDAAGAGRRMLAAGWPDERSVRAALIDPVPAEEVTEHFERAARSS